MHLGVKLHGVKAALHIGGDGKGRVGGGAIHLKPRRNAADMVAVAHPDLFIALGEPAIQQVKLSGRGCDISAPKLGCAVPAFHMATQHMHHHLLAVANAQDRHAQIKQASRGHRRAFGVNRGWAPR